MAAPSYVRWRACLQSHSHHDQGSLRGDSPFRGRSRIYMGVVRIATMSGGRLERVDSEAAAREPDEREIVIRIRSGLDDGLETLIERYGPEIQAVAFSICRDYQQAEDLTAETLSIAWRRIGSLRDPTRLRSWLLKIATRQALGYLRRTRNHPTIRQEGVEAASPNFESAAVDRVGIAQAMDRLPPRMRAVIALRYLADLTVDEISAATGKSKNTVKSEIRVGLRQLRATWLDDTDGLRGEP